ncbi:MAG: LapA family protein, partial [Dehalococcoidia bacterium]|nr:LapA family protein [Dehalococcoidia bacterium]
MNIFRLSLGLLVATILVVVGAQNTQSVAFHFLFWETRSMPVVLALALAVFLGALLAWIVSIPGRYRGMRSHRDLQHRAEHAEEAERAGHAQQVERAA